MTTHDLPHAILVGLYTHYAGAVILTPKKQWTQAVFQQWFIPVARLFLYDVLKKETWSLRYSDLVVKYY